MSAAESHSGHHSDPNPTQTTDSAIRWIVFVSHEAIPQREQRNSHGDQGMPCNHARLDRPLQLEKGGELPDGTKRKENEQRNRPQPRLAANIILQIQIDESERNGNQDGCG